MRVLKKIKKIIDYIPILWNDYDWDYSYIDKILLYKLKRMKKVFDKNKDKQFWDFGKEQSIYRQKAYKALCICILILERQINDFYFDTYRYLIDQDLKWEETENPEYYQLSNDWKISSNMDLYNKKEKLAEDCQKRDEKLFGYLFTTYKSCWWI